MHVDKRSTVAMGEIDTNRMEEKRIKNEIQICSGMLKYVFCTRLSVHESALSAFIFLRFNTSCYATMESIYFFTKNNIYYRVISLILC